MRSSGPKESHDCVARVAEHNLCLIKMVKRYQESDHDQMRFV